MEFPRTIMQGGCESWMPTPEGCPMGEGVDVCSQIERKTEKIGQRLELHIFNTHEHAIFAEK